MEFNDQGMLQVAEALKKNIFPGYNFIEVKRTKFTYWGEEFPAYLFELKQNTFQFNSQTNLIDTAVFLRPEPNGTITASDSNPVLYGFESTYGLLCKSVGREIDISTFKELCNKIWNIGNGQFVIHENGNITTNSNTLSTLSLVDSINIVLSLRSALMTSVLS